jgi:hypothetical protein
MTARRQGLRTIQGSRGVPSTVVVRQTELDDLLDEVSALQAEAIALAEQALPLARQLRLMANAVGPSSIDVAEQLIALLERQHRRHAPGSPRKAA